MDLKTFLSTIADSSDEIDRLTLSLVQRDIRQRGPAQRQLLCLHTSKVEERLFELLRVLDYTRKHDQSNSENKDTFVDDYLIQQWLLWRGKTALPLLLAALDDPALLVRQVAINVLGKIGNPEIFPAVFEILMNDPHFEQNDHSLRQIDIYIFCQLVTSQHLYLLIPMLIEGHAEQRNFVISCLENIGSAAISAVLPLLTEQDAQVRSIAATLLGTLGSPEAINALTTTLHDPNAEVRLQAVKALRQLNAQQALPAILEIVNDVDNNVRHEAMEASKSMGGPDLFEIHIADLQHPDASIRTRATSHLDADPRAVEPLIAALHDPNTEVRIQAARVLSHLGDQRAIEPLIYRSVALK